MRRKTGLTGLSSLLPPHSSLLTPPSAAPLQLTRRTRLLQSMSHPGRTFRDSPCTKAEQPCPNPKIPLRPAVPRSCAGSRRWASIRGAAVSTAISPSKTFSALPTDVPEDQRPRVRIAGRIVSRREGGKVHFLDVKDWSGRPTLREIKGEHEGEAEKVADLSSRIQVMIGQKQVGETGWQAGPTPRPRRPDRRRGDLRQDAPRRADRVRRRPDDADEIAATAPRQVGRDAGHGVPAAAPLPRSDLQPGHARPRPQARADRPHDPAVPGRPRLFRGGDADAARHRRRRRGPAVRHAPQRPGYRPLPAYRPGTAPEAAAGRRHRTGLRDRPGVPQ